MTVYFIGAGPGAADLLTLRAARLVSRCGTCLYAGSIVPSEVLATSPATARVVNTARMPLGDIIAEIRDADDRGDDVARLHSGDPSVYSAVAEQIQALGAEGIRWEIVPGVPAFAAAAAGLGVELTVPHVSQSVILTRVDGRATPMPAGEDLPSVCSSGATAVIHLAAAQTPRVVRELTPVYGADCPVAVVGFATRPDEVTVRGTLADIADLVAASGITRTAVIIVGRVLDRVGGDRTLRSFLYSDDRPRDADGRTMRGPGAAAPAGDPVPAPPAAGGAPHSARRPAQTPPAPRPPQAPPSPSDGRDGPGRILILGGTNEARQLADLMETAGLDVVTSLAGRVSRPRLPRGEVRIGGFGGPEGLAHWLRQNDVSAVIDATHPFAETISDSAARAAGHTGVPLLRLHRRPWSPQPDDEWIRVPDMAAAAEAVRERFRRPMLTVGRQGLAAFAGDTRGSYLIRCVEPPTGALPHRYLLVLDRGPFGVDSERALMSRHRIDALVTKNSGGEATEAKLEAARELRIPVVMVDRPQAPPAETVHTVDDAARWLVERFGSRQ
ncbi:MAG TPA: cobalt-precorrin-6A reductase [Candidatus Dietzia intestinipullorum]|nr:cobalt-precorrin-6A reductase [Candidatus Dietzia intestinipullorum]